MIIIGIDPGLKGGVAMLLNKAKDLGVEWME